VGVLTPLGAPFYLRLSAVGRVLEKSDGNCTRNLLWVSLCLTS
jgi:hypothetical protein